VPYRGIQHNQLWWSLRVAAVNLRQLLVLGLARQARFGRWPCGVSKPMTRPDRRACPFIIPKPAAAHAVAPTALAPPLATAFSPTSPRSPTPDSGAAAGMRWARCWP
jgi:hypothetical protein